MLKAAIAEETATANFDEIQELYRHLNIPDVKSKNSIIFAN